MTALPPRPAFKTRPEDYAQVRADDRSVQARPAAVATHDIGGTVDGVAVFAQGKARIVLTIESALAFNVDLSRTLWQIQVDRLHGRGVLLDADGEEAEELPTTDPEDQE